MGANASNVSDIVTNVSNNLVTTVGQNQAQYANFVNKIDVDYNDIEGSIKLEVLNSNISKANAILSSESNQSVDNQLEQDLLQEALGKVGALGLGVAETSNYVKSVTDMKTAIKKSTFQNLTQVASSINQLRVRGNKIKGDLKYFLENTSNFLSEQLLEDKSVQAAENKVKQTISQKASSTVESAGLYIFLILIAIAIIIFLVYAGGSAAIVKLLDSKLGIVIVVSVIVTVVLVILSIALAVSFLLKLPPYFNKEPLCQKASEEQLCGENECIVPEGAKETKVYMKAAPLNQMFSTIKKRELLLARWASKNNFFPIEEQQVLDKMTGEKKKLYDEKKKLYDAEESRLKGTSDNDLDKELMFPAGKFEQDPATGKWYAVGVFGVCNTISNQIKTFSKSAVGITILVVALIIVLLMFLGILWWVVKTQKLKRGGGQQASA